MNEPKVTYEDTALGLAMVTHFDSHEEGRLAFAEVGRRLALREAAFQEHIEPIKIKNLNWYDRLLRFIDSKLNGYGKGES